MDQNNENLIFVDKVVTKDLNQGKHNKLVADICKRLKNYIVEHDISHGIYTTFIYEVKQ